MPPYVADATAVADDPLARSVARLVLALSRQRWRPEGPAPVRFSTLVKLYGPIEPGAVESLVASRFAVQVTEGKDPLYRSTGLALGVGGFAESAIVLPDPDPADADPLPALVVDLARTGLPSVPAEGLACHLGRDVQDLWADLAQLAGVGLVALWPDHLSGPAASLTPYSLGRLGLRAAPDGSRWLRAGDPDPKVPAALDSEEDSEIDPFAQAIDFREVGGLDSLVLAEMVSEARRHRLQQITDAMDPERFRERQANQRREAVARSTERRHLIEATRRLPAAERKAKLAELDARHKAERWAAIRVRPVEQAEPVSLMPPPLPPFRFFLGMRASWPIPVGSGQEWRPWRPSDGPCPECGGQPIARLAVCLHCHRSGLDDLLNPPRPAKKPVGRPPGKASDPTPPSPQLAGLKGGLGS